MRANSLAFRLIVAAGLWSAIALIVAGFILTSLYRHNAERAFDDRLGVYLKTLIGNLANVTYQLIGKGTATGKLAKVRWPEAGKKLNFNPY